MTNKTLTKGRTAQVEIIKCILALAGAGLLLAGCASANNQNSGAMGNGSETTTYHESSPANPDSSPGTSTQPSGPNGSISRGNPFGMGGSGLIRAN